MNIQIFGPAKVEDDSVHETDGTNTSDNAVFCSASFLNSFRLMPWTFSL